MCWTPRFLRFMICDFKLTWMIGKDILKREKYFKYVSSRAFYNSCPACFRNMAAVPQGAFAAKKVRKNEEKRKDFHCAMELNPMNYSSKYMNSIWGQYNRYSVHNLKKIMDNGVFAMSASNDKRSAAGTSSVEKPSISTDLGSVGSAISFSSNQIFN